MDSNNPNNGLTPKQQFVERLRQSTNVLVTVSMNPSVDQLAAAIGLTLMLNKLNKHSTAVFSGQPPSTIEFLQPEHTLEYTTDSLRDFIISLDKSKADKLRYKVEDQVVKIFITPYRTSISEKDLQFSQGDFNVDAVVALGVDNRDHLDAAIMAHGRILHDATVLGVAAGSTTTDVGSINWVEPTASSLSEMIVSISESFQSGLIDSQMATAFLTGIVAETERFSNSKTNPKIMTMAAQLMAAGANQQLIANELKTGVLSPPPAAPGSPPPTQEGSIDVPHPEDGKPATTMNNGSGAPVSTDKPAEPPIPDINIDEHGQLQPIEEEKPAEAEAKAEDKPEDKETPKEEKKEEHTDTPSEHEDDSYLRGHEKVILPPADKQPSAGGHSIIMEPPRQGGSFSAMTDDEAEKQSDPFSQGPKSAPILSHQSGISFNPTPPPEPPAAPPPAPTSQPPAVQKDQTLADLEQSVGAHQTPSVSPLASSTPSPVSVDEPSSTLPPPVMDTPGPTTQPPAPAASAWSPPASLSNPTQQSLPPAPGPAAAAPSLQELLDQSAPAPNATNTSPSAAEPFTAESARSAVSSAISNAPYDPDHPEPLQALNAQPVDLGAQVITPTVSSTTSAPSEPVGSAGSPPPVPPPLIPPFPSVTQAPASGSASQNDGLNLPPLQTP